MSNPSATEDTKVQRQVWFINSIKRPRGVAGERGSSFSSALIYLSHQKLSPGFSLMFSKYLMAWLLRQDLYIPLAGISGQTVSLKTKIIVY